MGDRSTIMKRAWIIFRATYNHPAIPFALIGRAAFAWSLRKAWAEHRDAAKVAAIPAPVKTALAADLRSEMSMLTYRADFRRAEQRRHEIEHELSRLAA